MSIFISSEHSMYRSHLFSSSSIFASLSRSRCLSLSLRLYSCLDRLFHSNTLKKSLFVYLCQSMSISLSVFSYASFYVYFFIYLYIFFLSALSYLSVLLIHFFCTLP